MDIHAVNSSVVSCPSFCFRRKVLVSAAAGLARAVGRDLGGMKCGDSLCLMNKKEV